MSTVSPDRRKEEEDMINTSHKVSYVDDYTIYINVVFNKAFPIYSLEGTQWVRNSEETFLGEYTRFECSF